MTFWRLDYQDRFVASIQPEIDGDIPTEGYAPFFFPPEGAYLKFFFTAEEFKKVYTALLNGADLTYGADAQNVMWSFLRNVEFPVVDPVDCGDIQDCIENNQGTRELIQEIVDQGTTPDGSKIIAGNDDLDKLFGQCRFIVDTMYDAIVDFNQIEELGTNLRERATLLFEAIPVLELLPIDEFAEYVDGAFEDVASAFDGQWTTTPVTGSRDRLSCGLFCLARDHDNQLSWTLVKDYFWSLVNFESTIPDLIVDFIGFMVTGSWSGQDVVNISFAQLATALEAGSRFGQLVFPQFAQIAALGSNDPDPDWEILCTDCAAPTDCQGYPFNIDGAQGWAGLFGTVLVTGQGWDRSDFNNTSIFLASAPIAVHRVTVRFVTKQPSGVAVYAGSGATLAGTLTYNPGAADWSGELTSDIAEGVRIEIGATGPIDDGILQYVELCPAE